MKTKVTMRSVFNSLIKELGYEEGKEVFEWYCKAYNVVIEDEAPSTIVREVYS